MQQLKHLFFIIIKFVIITFLLILSIIGLCDFNEYLFPEKIPPVYYIGITEERKMANYINGSWYEFGDTPEDNWKKLQPTLRILRKVCPEAASWVVEKHDQNKIIWGSSSFDEYATYDFFDETISINRPIIEKKDGEKAVIIAHEFRHSRQKKSKLLKKLLIDFITQKDNEDIIEKEAYDFGREVYIAIHQ